MSEVRSSTVNVSNNKIENTKQDSCKTSSRPSTTCGTLIRVSIIIAVFGGVCCYFWNETLKLKLDNDIDINAFRMVDLRTLTKFEAQQEIGQRRAFIKNMAREAWSGYVRYAWGQDALEPVSRTAYRQWLGNNGGLSLVQAMSTLFVMNMSEEFDRARQWIANEFNFSAINREVNVFVSVTELMGSLLSCYALTGDVLFLEKAIQVANALEPAYRTPKGLPSKKIMPSNAHATGSNVLLGEVGGQHLEYHYLYMVTKDYVYERRIAQIRQHLRKLDNNGLYLSELDSFSGEWTTDRCTLFGAGSAFYSYLLKSFIQSGKKDLEALKMYKEAMASVQRHVMFDTFDIDLPNARVALKYARDNYGQYAGNFMIHDGCYLGAMLSLGANVMQTTNKFSEESGTVQQTESNRQHRRDMNQQMQHWKLAENITETCRLSSVTNTGLPPYYMFVDDPKVPDSSFYNQYFLSPELAESYFVLWRLTRDPKYREYAWQMAQSIYIHCRTANGFSNIAHVDQVPTFKTNYQPPHFLGATLKYLYLIFTDDTQLPLDQWVFNRAGQPLPICENGCLTRTQ